jgi:PAS domain S-box-containing protein
LREAEEPLNLLLVDDRIENLVAYEAVLSSPSYNLVRAQSGREALEKVSQMSFAVILLDIQMPGMDGFETAQRIRESQQGRDVLIVFVTALDRDPKYIERGYKLGAVDYVFKPIDPVALRAKVKLFADLHRRKEQARASETRFRMMVQGVKDYAIFMLSPEGNVETWNEGAHRLKGYDASEIIGQHFSRFYEQKDLDADKPGLELGEAARTGRFEDDGWRLRKDGGRFWANVIISAIRDERGKLVGFSKVTRDLTERKRNEEALRKAHDELEARVAERTSELMRKDAFLGRVVEASRDCIKVLDLDGRLTFMNAAGAQAFELRDAREVLGLSWLSFYHDEHLASAQAALEAAKAGQVGRFVGYCATPSGTPKWWDVVLSGVVGPDGRIEKLLCVSRDVTEQKLAEQRAAFLTEVSALLSSSLDYRATLHGLARLACASMADWCTVTLVGEEGAKERVAIAHRDPSKVELIGDLARYYPPDWSEEEGGIGGVIRSGKAMLMERVPDEALAKAAKDERHLAIMRELGCLSCVVVPIALREKTFGAIAFVSAQADRIYGKGDVALAEEIARRAAVAIDNALLYETAQKAIAARDEFLSIASHELKTPITSLKLQLQITRRNTKPELNIVPPADKLARTLDVSALQVERLATLVDDLLDVSKIQAGKLSFSFEAVDVAALAHEMVERYGEHLRTAGCEATVDAPAPVVVWADRFRLEQVMLNLLSNAAKYGRSRPVVLSVKQEGAHAMISCRDNGMGIAVDKLSRVFERFERAIDSSNISGLGLGLYITREIVHAHHGQIRVESELGKGSCFFVELPLGGPAAERAGTGTDEGRTTGLAESLA